MGLQWSYMDRVLQSYKAKLDSWTLTSFKGDFSGGNNVDFSSKFYPSGEAKPFYGLTVVAFIEPESALHIRLCDFQNRIRTALKSAGIEEIFSFLDPLSFHMTLCDIVASSFPLDAQNLLEAVEVGRTHFPKLGNFSELTCQLIGMGVDRSLLQLANFETESSLNQCLQLEKQLKQCFGVDERSFLGHISLAYFVQMPVDQLGRIKETLAPFSEEALGEFAFSRVSLCHFSDMNSYIPLLSIDLLEGSIEDYRNNSKLSGTHA